MEVQDVHTYLLKVSIYIFKLLLIDFYSTTGITSAFLDKNAIEEAEAKEILNEFLKDLNNDVITSRTWSETRRRSPNYFRRRYFYNEILYLQRGKKDY